MQNSFDLFRKSIKRIFIFPQHILASASVMILKLNWTNDSILLVWTLLPFSDFSCLSVNCTFSLTWTFVMKSEAYPKQENFKVTNFKRKLENHIECCIKPNALAI